MGTLRDQLLALVEAGILDLRDVPVHLRRAAEVVNVRYNGRRKGANYKSRTFTVRGTVFGHERVREPDAGRLSNCERAVLIGPGGLPPKARSANKIWGQCEQYGIGWHKPAKFPVRGFYRDKQAATGQGLAIADVL